MQFKAFAPGIEVSGRTVKAIVEAFRLFPSVALNLLVRHGIAHIGPDRQVVIDAERWYPQEKWLAAYEAVATSGGADLLFDTGRFIPRNAGFQMGGAAVHATLASIDVAYHQNHRKNGRLMYDAATRTMLEGIGHYRYEGAPSTSRIVMVCENPYPCDFDRGIITEIAVRSEPKAKVVHDAAAPCRKNGAESCTYVVSW
jgi:hypothetical protein